MLLQLLDLVTDCGMGDTQFFPSIGEAAMSGRCFKGPQSIQWWETFSHQTIVKKSQVKASANLEDSNASGLDQYSAIGLNDQNLIISNPLEIGQLED